MDIDALLREHEGDEAFVAELLALFLEQFGGAPAEISARCAGGEWEAAGKLVHSLKGTAGTLKAKGLYEAAKAVNGALRASYYEGLSELLPRLDREFSATRLAIEGWLERTKK